MTAVVHAARRGFRRVVTIQPGGKWPEQDASGTAMNLPHYAWVHLANRATPGSGNDLWASFTGPLSTVDKPDRIVPAGEWMTEQLAGPGDDLATGLHLVNLGATAVDVVVILSKNPIHYDLGAMYPAGVGSAGGVDVSDRAARQLGLVQVLRNGGGSAIDGTSLLAADASFTPGNTALMVQAIQLAVTADSGGNAVKLRTPSQIWLAEITGTGGVARTPTSGKKFRAMRFFLSLSAEATVGAAGRVAISLYEGTANTNIAIFHPYIPAAAPAAAEGALWQSPWIDLGNGYLASAANDTLNAGIGTALTAGSLTVVVAGTEE